MHPTLIKTLVVIFLILLFFGGKTLPGFSKGLVDSIKAYRKGLEKKERLKEQA